jgi:hypothetical protein
MFKHTLPVVFKPSGHAHSLRAEVSAEIEDLFARQGLADESMR